MCPADPFDEAVADMISDGVVDLRIGAVKLYYEKDEAKTVFNLITIIMTLIHSFLYKNLFSEE